MKNIRKAAALLAALLTLTSALISCGAPAPSGMYAPVDAMKYVEGVENAIFSVPEDYAVTMSSNTLAAKKDSSVFSLQCRHSDYYYGSLKKNYEELKSQLLGLYGSYTEEMNDERTVAGQKALEVRYSLTVSGEQTDYVQYFFYEGRQHFYLFTYSEKAGQIDEQLLQRVLETVSLVREGYTPPSGFRAVQNAEADKIDFDRYELYIPDDWILDTSAGQICMRVPSSKTVSTIMFHEIDGGEDLEKLVSDYAAKFAPSEDFGRAGVLEKYILTNVYRMIGEFKDFKIVVSSDGSASETELSKSSYLARREEYLQTYTNDDRRAFSYIEYTAKFSDFYDHGSGGLFVDSSRIARDEEEGNLNISPEAVYADYRVRQYFVRSANRIYFFTYVSTTGAFKNQEADAVKVVKNFVIKDGTEK